MPPVLDPTGITTPRGRYLSGNSLIDARSTQVDSRHMGIAVLGPLTIDGDDGHGLRDRVVLEALVVRAGTSLVGTRDYRRTCPDVE